MFSIYITSTILAVITGIIITFSLIEDNKQTLHEESIKKKEHIDNEIIEIKRRRSVDINSSRGKHTIML